MGKYSKAEVEEAFNNYCARVDQMAEAGDWSTYIDMFTDDARLIDHGFGTFEGREAFNDFVVKSLAPFPHIKGTPVWVAYDEENDAVVACIRNALVHPTDPSIEFSSTYQSRLVYAGNGLFSSEEDVYNPSLPGGSEIGSSMVEDWLAAGGQLAAEPLSFQH